MACSMLLSGPFADSQPWRLLAAAFSRLAGGMYYSRLQEHSVAEPACRTTATTVHVNNILDVLHISNILGVLQKLVASNIAIIYLSHPRCCFGMLLFGKQGICESVHVSSMQGSARK